MKHRCREEARKSNGHDLSTLCLPKPGPPALAQRPPAMGTFWGMILLKTWKRNEGLGLGVKSLRARW